MIEAALTLTLPCVCPEPDCGVYLQRLPKYIEVNDGVGPHYRLMHPRATIPVVASQP